jgi:polysaccharide biosynthesis protein PslG
VSKALPGSGRQRWLVVAAALVVTLGAGAAGELGLTANANLKPSQAASASTAATSGKIGAAVPLAVGAHPLKFGLDYASTLMTESPAEIRTSLRDAVTEGTKWIRVDLPWETVQPDDALTYKWGKFDEVADTAKSLGIKIDAILDATAYWDTTPACKRAVPDTTLCPPSSNDDFARFAAAAVRRYENRGVGAWEIWNEPNMSGRWWPAPDPVAYTRMLSTVAAAVRGVDRNAFVLMGGLAAVPTNPKLGYISQNDFLAGAANVPGGLTNVDAISYHPFSAPTRASRAGDFSDISGSPDNLLRILQLSNNPKVQIWITESGDTEYDGRVLPFGTTPTAAQLQAQAAYAADLVATVSTNPNVAADFWFADQDIPSQHLYWGLRDETGKTRPVFTALKQAIAACGCSVD